MESNKNKYGITEGHNNFLINGLLPLIKSVDCNLIIFVGKTRKGKSRLSEIAYKTGDFEHIELAQLRYLTNELEKRFSMDELEFDDNLIPIIDECILLENPLEAMYLSNNRKLVLCVQHLRHLPELAEWKKDYLVVEFFDQQKAPNINYVDVSKRKSFFSSHIEYNNKTTRFYPKDNIEQPKTNYKLLGASFTFSLFALFLLIDKNNIFYQTPLIESSINNVLLVISLVGGAFTAFNKNIMLLVQKIKDY